MRAGDVTDTLELALKASGLTTANVVHRPRLLSDNGSSYISRDLATWLDSQRMRHVRGAPHHPMTQGKIERWHQTLKNQILLENHFLPGDLEAQVDAFVEHYNQHRYHEALGNLTPADVCFGRDWAILQERQRIKHQTIAQRRLLHRSAAADHEQPDAPEPTLSQDAIRPKIPDDGQLSAVEVAPPARG